MAEDHKKVDKLIDLLDALTRTTERFIRANNITLDDDDLLRAHLDIAKKTCKNEYDRRNAESQRPTNFPVAFQSSINNSKE